MVSVPICPESWSMSLSGSKWHIPVIPVVYPCRKSGFPIKKSLSPIQWELPLASKTSWAALGCKWPHFDRIFVPNLNQLSCQMMSDVSLVPSLPPLGIVQLCGTARAKSVIPQRREMAPGYTVYFRDDRGDPWGCNRNEWLSCGDASYACPPTIPRWN